ncbi:endonuclease/exonuclease/phosphatase family protein [Alteribacillus sp. HJP-4]|uniref:endonuclease/exonuclease/phosphatase family protein n=1 Tax=Alteribacillus sp. HJP-4 TaxID=2775394 RepID=UPI0035CD1EA9
MKIMTFNLRVHIKEDGADAWPNRVLSAAKLIQESGAAVIGVQEARRSMLEDLQKELPHYSWIGRSRSEESLDEHCAVFYNDNALQLETQDTFWLSDTPEVPASVSWDASFPRICTWAKFKHLKNQQSSFYVFNTHLDHVGETARINGVRLIQNFIGSQNYSPFIVLGDFNAKPASPAIQQLDKTEPTFLNTFGSQQNIGKTFHDFKGGDGGEPIDYIFVSNDISYLPAEILRNKIDGRFPSDHYPVITSVQLPIS